MLFFVCFAVKSDEESEKRVALENNQKCFLIPTSRIQLKKAHMISKHEASVLLGKLYCCVFRMDCF